MEEQAFVHKSVLLCEIVGSLSTKPGGIYVDGTLSGGGYAYEVCRRLGNGRLTGIDQDTDVIVTAGKRLEHFKDKVTIVRSGYENTKIMLEDLELSKVDSVYLDPGVSSYQLDKASRGFTYRGDASLDMRMDQRNTITVTDIVNTYGEMELYGITRDYGEDNLAKSTAKHIIRGREEHPIETMGQLAEIVKNTIPARIRVTDGHSAKYTLQVTRIECNHELDILEHSIDIMIGLLNPGGRPSIITFHSLEDRIVKNWFRTNENPRICLHEFSVCVCDRKSKGKMISRKPVLPSEKKLEENSRPESAKPRVSERG